MKKILCLLLAATVILAILTTESFAAEGLNWYVKRAGKEKPSLDARQMEAIDAGALYIGDGDERVIYLTFDAGYENGNIEKILDILQKKEVPAAFFILRHLISKNADIVIRMHSEGHLVCNHTTDHKDMTRLEREDLCKNILELDKLCKSRCGFDMDKFFRFPEGRYTADAIRSVNSLGYKTVFWSFAYADWDNASQPAPERAMKLILENTHPGEIILLHPTSATNASILAQLIDKWREDGYRFGSLEELTK